MRSAPARRARVARFSYGLGGLPCKTICLTVGRMADTITIRTDDETEHALEVLTHGGVSRSAAIRQAVLDAASRRERAAQMRRAVLHMELGHSDGTDVAAELARDRTGER
jgi:predicted transcriptional regulator